MSKQISNRELATIVARLLIKPDSIGQLDSQKKHLAFMTDIAQVVCDHCGGEIHYPADAFTGEPLIGIHGNDSLPADGGIWKTYDRDGSLFPEMETDFFAVAFLAKSIVVSDADFAGGIQEIQLRRDLVAQEILKTYPMETTITAELYDQDTILASCLNAMNTVFEFPNWCGRTLAEFWKKHSFTTNIQTSPTVIQYQTYHHNKEGVCAGNITLSDCLAATPQENGWRLPNGFTLRFIS